MPKRLLIGVLVLSGVIAEVAAVPQRPVARSFDCLTTFTKDTTAEQLVNRFGRDAVVTGDIYLGEGEHEDGTILFDTVPDDRVEVLWRDRAAQRNPRAVRIRGTSSHWRTPLGLTLGDTLRRVEALNRRPFRLLGYGSEGSGLVMSWSSGELATQDAADCRTRARFDFPLDHARQLLVGPVWVGNQEFSSGHPAFQAVPPKVKEVILDFDRVGEFTIRPSGVGPIAIGMTAAQTARMFPPERRKTVEFTLEGRPVQGLSFTVPSSTLDDGLVAELQDTPTGNIVNRVWIRDPAVRTAKGVGVGSTVAFLRNAYRIAWIDNGEGSVYMRVEELGASFELDQNGPEGMTLPQIKDPNAVPGDVKIIGILLTGRR